MKKLVLAGMLIAIVVTAGTTAGFALAGGEAKVLPDEGPNPDVCNIAACDGGGTPQLHPVRSDEGLDPNLCNPVHNINVCTAEELEELGMVGPLGTAGKVTHGDPTYEEWLSNYASPGFEVEDTTEPLFVDGRPQYQSLNDAIVEDCGLAGGTVYATSDGEVGCVVGEGSSEEVQPAPHPPLTVPVQVRINE